MQCLGMNAPHSFLTIQPLMAHLLAFEKFCSLCDELKYNAGHGQWGMNWFDKMFGRWAPWLTTIGTVLASIVTRDMS